MTDTDHLSTPADMATVLARLAAILRDVEGLPANAQQRFWNDLQVPAEDIKIGPDVSLLTTQVLYNILATMCGPRLAELTNGATKDYYDKLMEEMRTMAHREGEWDTFLDTEFDQHKGLSSEGHVAASVTLHGPKDLGHGKLKLVPDAPQLLALVDSEGRERYFARSSILMLNID